MILFSTNNVSARQIIFWLSLKIVFLKVFCKRDECSIKTNLLVLKCWIKGISKWGISIKEGFFSHGYIFGEKTTSWITVFDYTYDDDRLKSDFSCGADSVSLNTFSSGIAVSLRSSLGFPTLSSNWTKVS